MAEYTSGRRVVQAERRTGNTVQLRAHSLTAANAHARDDVLISTLSLYIPRPNVTARSTFLYQGNSESEAFHPNHQFPSPCAAQRLARDAPCKYRRSRFLVVLLASSRKWALLSSRSLRRNKKWQTFYPANKMCLAFFHSLTCESAPTDPGIAYRATFNDGDCREQAERAPVSTDGRLENSRQRKTEEVLVRPRRTRADGKQYRETTTVFSDGRLTKGQSIRAGRNEDGASLIFDHVKRACALSNFARLPD